MTEDLCSSLPSWGRGGSDQEKPIGSTIGELEEAMAAEMEKTYDAASIWLVGIYASYHAQAISGNKTFGSYYPQRLT